MDKKTYVLNSIHAALVGVILLVMVIVRAFAPAVILPDFGVTNLVLVSLIALVLDHYLAPGAKRCYICIPVFSAIATGLLPWCAGFAAPVEALKLAVLGGVVFTATTWVYTSMADRLSSGPAAKAAPVVSAFGVYLAVQCLMCMF
ncbi:MAG: hypothetical protein IJ001_10200 [Oscillospiraceae bacterium]|nr:hypothetical protein [Oscillospiraceae bacterium]